MFLQCKDRMEASDHELPQRLHRFTRAAVAAGLPVDGRVDSFEVRCQIKSKRFAAAMLEQTQQVIHLNLL